MCVLAVVIENYVEEEKGERVRYAFLEMGRVSFEILGLGGLKRE